MRKLTVLASATLLLVLSGRAAQAEEGKKTCLLAQQFAQTPAAATQTIRGVVRDIVGDLVTMELRDGTTRTLTLTRRERGDIGRLISQDVVVTPVYCNRVSIYREPPPPARQLTVPPLPPARPVVPQRPLTPPPPPQPQIPQAPQPRPIIPQTW